jgi:hypothetical protein
MSQQVLSRNERLKLFLREYYLGHTVWINTIRLVGGPLIIATGIQFYYKAERSAIAYGGFCFLYGIYYLLKPFLIIAVRPSLIQPLSFSISIEEQGIKWQENGDEASIQFSSFQKIAKQSGYYSLKLPEKATIYLRAAQLAEEEKAILNNKLIIQ